jgi:hypothetical protein
MFLALIAGTAGCSAREEARATALESGTASGATTSETTETASSTTMAAKTTTTSSTTTIRRVVATTGTMVPYEVGFYVRGPVFEAVAFGESYEFALQQLVVLLGNPDRDTGWHKDDTCDGSSTRRVYWGGLEAVFTKGANGEPPGSLTFQQWSITTRLALTPEGIGVGSTVADLKRAYPTAKVTRARSNDDGAIFITRPEGGPFIQGLTKDSGDRALISEMWAGLACQRIVGA